MNSRHKVSTAFAMGLIALWGIIAFACGVAYSLSSCR